VGLNLPPTATAAATPSSGVAPLTVAFSSAGSSDPEGAPLTYNWDFGDGTTSTAANPGKTYSASGAYIAQLRVSDGTNTSLPSPVIISVGSTANGLVAAYGFEEGSGSRNRRCFRKWKRWRYYGCDLVEFRKIRQCAFVRTRVIDHGQRFRLSTSVRWHDP